MAEWQIWSIIYNGFIGSENKAVYAIRIP